MNIRSIYRSFSNLLGATPLHPQYFSKRFISREVKKAVADISGLCADLGCGFGPYRKFFSDVTVIGLDYPTTQPDGQNQSAMDVAGDMLNLPFADGSFDYVLCTQVLEHVMDPAKAVSEIGRILKSGGVLIFSAPFFYPLHDEPYDFFRYTPHGLKVLFDRAGLEMESITTQGGFIPLFGELLNLYCIHKLLRLIERGGFFKVAAFLISPIFLILAVVNNLICIVLSSIDKERRFAMDHFVISRKIYNHKKNRQ